MLFYVSVVSVVGDSTSAVHHVRGLLGDFCFFFSIFLFANFWQIYKRCFLNICREYLRSDCQPHRLSPH